MNDDFKNLYLKNPCYYSLFPYEKVKNDAFCESDYVKIEKDLDFLSFNFEKSFHETDYNKGYKEICVCENIYNKIKSKLKYNYSAKKYVKACIYGSGDALIEADNHSKKTFEKSEFKLFTTFFPFEDNDSYTEYDDYRIWYQLKLIPIEEIDSYDKLLLKMKEINITKKKPTLLLHSCCGPCSSYVLKFLHDFFDITILYYNPNIFPRDEYNHRLDTQKEIVKKLGYNIKIIEDVYDHKSYLDYIKGEENCEEKGKRCYLCYERRLKRTAFLAQSKYDYFTTTISISPYKVSSYLNEIGKKLENEYNVKYLYSDFKLNDGYKKSIILSKLYNLYRQEYCGCEFSKNKN